MLSKVLSSAKRSLQGREDLNVVLYGWGLGLYIGSIIVGGFVFFTPFLAASKLGQCVGYLGLILVFIYPFVFYFALLRCAKNSTSRLTRTLTVLYALLFIPAIHLPFGAFIGMASIALTEAHYTRIGNP